MSESLICSFIIYLERSERIAHLNWAKWANELMSAERMSEFPALLLNEQLQQESNFSSELNGYTILFSFAMNYLHEICKTVFSLSIRGKIFFFFKKWWKLLLTNPYLGKNNPHRNRTNKLISVKQNYTMHMSCLVKKMAPGQEFSVEL